MLPDVWRIHVDDELSSWLCTLEGDDLDFAVAALDVLQATGPISTRRVAGHGLKTHRTYTVWFRRSATDTITVSRIELLKHRSALFLRGRCVFIYRHEGQPSTRPALQLVQAAVQVLPVEHRERYEEEFRADLASLPTAAVRWRYGISLLLNSWALRRALSASRSAAGDGSGVHR